jgi:hypothetical protein
MTYQGDPDGPRRRPSDDMRSRDGRANWVPIVLVAAFVLVVGLLFFGGPWGTQTEREATAPGTSANPPASKPTPPSPTTPATPPK